MHTTDATIVLDRGQLRDITMDDRELMRDLLAALIDDTAKHLGQLADAIAREDGATCSRLAHCSKGACANVGANRLAALLRQIEGDASSRAFQECGRVLELLPAEIELLRGEQRSFQ